MAVELRTPNPAQAVRRRIQQEFGGEIETPEEIPIMNVMSY